MFRSAVHFIHHTFFFLKESDAFPSIKYASYTAWWLFIFNETKSRNKKFCKICIFIKNFNIYWTSHFNRNSTYYHASKLSYVTFKNKVSLPNMCFSNVKSVKIVTVKQKIRKLFNLYKTYNSIVRQYNSLWP